MTGYNPDQQPKCRLTESAFRDDKRCCPEGQRYVVLVAPGFSPARPLSACRPKIRAPRALTGAPSSRTCPERCEERGWVVGRNLRIRKLYPARLDLAETPLPQADLAACDVPGKDAAGPYKGRRLV